MIIETLERSPTGKGLAQVFKALGDENRLAIFQLLRERCAGGCELTEDGADRTVSEIARAFDLALSTVSHHLKQFRIAEPELQLVVQPALGFFQWYRSLSPGRRAARSLGLIAGPQRRISTRLSKSTTNETLAMNGVLCE